MPKALQWNIVYPRGGYEKAARGSPRGALSCSPARDWGPSSVRALASCVCPEIFHLARVGRASVFTNATRALAILAQVGNYRGQGNQGEK